MTTFTITTAQNITALTGKGGSDTYNVNGGSLTIDSDTRYGPNTSAVTGPFGNLNTSAALGGTLTIRGDNVRLIPYHQGSGSVPASGMTIASSGVTAELLCVMTSRVGGIVTLPGSPLPVTGWLKVRNVSIVNSFLPGLLTGISATSTNVDETGWMEVVGVETFGISTNRLNQFTATGVWFDLGLTTGVRGQKIQLPAFDAITEYPGFEIETAPDSGIYAFWPNAALKFRGDTVSTDSRSRFVGITSAALATIGTGLDNQPAGDLPPAGCKMRVPNIVFSSCATANKAVNSQPSLVMGTRYDINTAGSAVVNLTRVTGSWYWSISQPQAVTIQDLHTCDQFAFFECSTSPVINGLHVGLSNLTTPLASPAINISQQYAGNTTISNISGLRAEGISSSGYAIQFVNCYGKWTVNNIRGHYASDCTSVSGPIFINSCDDFTLNNPEVIGKRLMSLGCNRVAINNVVYADNVRGTTLTTAACCALEFMGNTKVATVNGISLWPGVTNVHPYNGLVYVNTTFDLTVTGIGSSSVPLTAGSVNRMGYLLSDGGNNARCRFRRNWLTNLRIGLYSSNNTSVGMQVQNCYNVDASISQVPNWQNGLSTGNRHNAGAVLTSFVHVTGTHFWDAFTGDTTTRASVIFVEKSDTAESLAAYTIDAGNPKFTAQGAVVMSGGDRVTWTWNYLMLGWSGLTSMAATGTNATTNHTYEYDVDKGSGYSDTFKVMSNANLQAETGISALGVRLKIRITCTTNSTNNQITSFRVDGTTTAALQNAALYPLDFASVQLSGLQAGSSVSLFPETPVPGAVPSFEVQDTDVATTLSFAYDSSVQIYTLRVRKAGFHPVDLVFPNTMVTTIPLAQQQNKDGFGIPIYGRGTVSPEPVVTIDAPALRIDLSNTRCNAEEVYNLVSEWQATSLGMRYPEALRFDGTDLLILGAWRFRRAMSSYTSAGIDALPVIDGNPTGSPDDESNGSIDFRARSVRTYQINAAPAITAADLAAAVWGFAQGNGATAEANLRGARTAAENAFAVSS